MPKIAGLTMRASWLDATGAEPVLQTASKELSIVPGRADMTAAAALYTSRTSGWDDCGKD